MVRRKEPAQPRTAPDGPGNGPLQPRQEAAALALACGCDLAEAARRSHAGKRTIKTWTATVPGFARRVGELRAEMTARALGRLADGMTDAADTLGFLCRKGRSEQVRLGAARALLELGVRLREAVELEQRVAALEAVKQGRAS